MIFEDNLWHLRIIQNIYEYLWIDLWKGQFLATALGAKLYTSLFGPSYKSVLYVCLSKKKIEKVKYPLSRKKDKSSVLYIFRAIRINTSSARGDIGGIVSMQGGSL